MELFKKCICTPVYCLRVLMFVSQAFFRRFFSFRCSIMQGEEVIEGGGGKGLSGCSVVQAGGGGGGGGYVIGDNQWCSDQWWLKTL